MDKPLESSHLAEQVTCHLLSYLSEDDARKVLRLHQKELASFVHVQMLQRHFWQDTKVAYDVVSTRGFTELRNSAYTAAANEPPLDFRISPSDKSNMSRYLFGGFSRCLYPTQKFQWDAERKLAVIRKRIAQVVQASPRPISTLLSQRHRGRRIPAGFRRGDEHAHFDAGPKAANQIADPDVLAKRDVAVEWCRHASEHAANYQGKPWTYLLIPHDAIAETGA